MTTLAHRTAALHAAAFALKTPNPSTTLGELLDALDILPQRQPRPARPDRAIQAACRPPVDAELYLRVQAAYRAGTDLDEIAQTIGRTRRATERLLAGHLVGPFDPANPTHDRQPVTSPIRKPAPTG